jgi:hypothetical protein
MNATMAIMVRDVAARRELILLAVAVAVLISLLPFLPNIVDYEKTDVRTIASAVGALAFGCIFALLFGATIFGNDLSEGRLGYFFSRPVSGFAIWWGRMLAAMAVVWIVEIIVLIPALYHEGIRLISSRDVTDWLTILAYIILPLLFFLLAHWLSILVRAGTPWLFLDLGGAIVFAVLAWLNLIPMLEIGAPIALWVVGAALVGAVLISLSVGGAIGIAAGRVDLKRVHSAHSLALWSTMAIMLAAVTVYTGWLRNFGPRDFDNVEVMTISPDGNWIDVFGGTKNRLDVRRRYLVSTTSHRWLRLPHGWRGLQSEVVCAPDSSAAIWRGRAAGDEPRPLWWADLGRPDPSPKPTNIVVSSNAVLSLSTGGTHLAILEDGTLSVYALGEEKLVKAIRLADDLHSAAVVFTSGKKLRLFSREGEDAGFPLRIADVELATGNVVVMGEIQGVGALQWFAVDGSLDFMIVSTEAADDFASKRTLYDATDGTLIRALETAGFPRFLSDGRLVFVSRANDPLRLTVETIDGDERVTHDVGDAAELTISGEAKSGHVVLSRLEVPGDRTRGQRVELFSLESGERGMIGSRLWRSFSWLPWQPGQIRGFFWYNRQPEASRLFFDRTGAVVRWDPESGELVHVVGGHQK